MKIAIWIVVAVGGVLTTLGFLTSDRAAFFSACSCWPEAFCGCGVPIQRFVRS